MYPRLFLARNLLKQDGVIFVSIDDNEVHNLRMIMNEIFGEENFEGMISWRRRTNQPNDDTKMIAKVSEYILVFSKNSETLKESKTFNKISISENRLASYSNPDNDSRGDWSSTPWCASKGQGGSKYEIKTPSGKIYEETWLGTKDTFERLLKEDKIIFPNNGNGKPRKKIFKRERLTQGQPAIDFWFNKRFGDNLSANSEIKELLGNERLFDYPKPTNLVKTILEITTQKDSIILDFFAGSGTTAHAVMEQNAEDGGNRKWICVQLPELCDENSEAFKAGYKNIAEIAKERIRRAGKKIREEKENIDIGFKSFKLDKSNFKIWQGKFKDEKSLLSALDEFVDNLEKGSNKENILYELILKSGLDLNVPMKEKEIGSSATAKAKADKEKYFDLGNGKLFIYLGENISIKMAEKFIEMKPEKIICLERAFQNNDELKTNILLQAEQEDVDFKVI
jgi:adenine-specific DNA-methyltransferase